MSKEIQQNQLLNIEKLLSEGKIDLAIKIADDNIKNKTSWWTQLETCSLRYYSVINF